MIPAVRSWTRDEMMKRVAFFKDLKRIEDRVAGQRSAGMRTRTYQCHRFPAA